VRRLFHLKRILPKFSMNLKDVLRVLNTISTSSGETAGSGPSPWRRDWRWMWSSTYEDCF
jgi:hypothetical protein